MRPRGVALAVAVTQRGVRLTQHIAAAPQSSLELTRTGDCDQEREDASKRDGKKQSTGQGDQS